MSSQYNYRFVAQIILEATTPLKTASGKSDFFVDEPVLKDWNGLPMILGTSIAGVLRKSFREYKSNKYFTKLKKIKCFNYIQRLTLIDYNYQWIEFVKNYNIFGNKNGSRLLVSNAHLLDENQKLHHSLGIENRTEFLQRYSSLPIREHTAITHRGVAKEHSKFDEEVVFAGSRFKFELEFIGEEEDEAIWQSILELLKSPLFRLGGGSSKGFGEMKVVSCLESSYIIGKNYQDKPSDLNKSVGKEIKLEGSRDACIYKITLKPDSFFSFGAGFGDDEVDDISVTEEIVKWKKKQQGYFSKKQLLLPASSLKGALSHRVAFHYNKIKKIYADKIDLEDFDNYIGENNKAVATIFGASKSHKFEGKGKALFSDIFQEFNENEVKIFDHVKIDRFTGGAIESALYSEKVNAQKDIWSIEIVLEKALDEDIRKAFEDSLDDLCKGLLPLGGKVNRGHGIFEGSWNKEGCNDKE